MPRCVSNIVACVAFLNLYGYSSPVSLILMWALVILLSAKSLIWICANTKPSAKLVLDNAVEWVWFVYFLQLFSHAKTIDVKLTCLGDQWSSNGNYEFEKTYIHRNLNMYVLLICLYVQFQHSVIWFKHIPINP